jgi:hypothetical protein
MSDATWTVLIATLGQRAERFQRVLDQLLPQTESYDGRVTVSALYNHGERKLGDVRQDLIDDATSDYVSFVDDDDILPDYYVAEVVPWLGKVDYVGWRMQCYIDGKKMKPTFHSLRYRRWTENHKGYYRDVSHLNPVRTELARKVNYRTISPPEDFGWANRMRPHLKSEGYIDRIMYYYHASSKDTTWRPGSVRQRKRHPARPQINHPNFAYHSGSSA